MCVCLQQFTMQRPGRSLGAGKIAVVGGGFDCSESRKSGLSGRSCPIESSSVERFGYNAPE